VSQERNFQKKRQNVLLVLQHLGYLKHFENTLQKLTGQGTFVTVIYYKQKKHFSPAVLDRISKFNNIQVIYFDSIISGSDKKLSSKMRRNIDFFQYKKSIYKDCPELVARFKPVSEWRSDFPESYIKSLSSSSETGKIKTPEQKIELLSDLFYSFIAPSAKLVKKLNKVKPNSILISPFLDGDVEPYAFLKYGRERQIPVTYLMASWDNLQNKGVAQPAPDQYLVWTDEHKRQMIEIHGADEDRVHVVGSEILETWGRYTNIIESSTIVPGNREIRILYFCSSPFISAGKEDELLIRIINFLAEKNFNGCQIQFTIKTHPQVDLINFKAKLEHDTKFNFVTIHNSLQNVSDDELVRSEFMEMLQKNDICIGLNTSILLESAIQGSTSVMISNTFENFKFPKTLHSTFLSKYATTVVKDFSEFDDLLENLEKYSNLTSENTEKIRRDFLISNDDSVSSRVMQALISAQLRIVKSFPLDVSEDTISLKFKNLRIMFNSVFLALSKWATYRKVISILRDSGARSLFQHIQLHFQYHRMSKYELPNVKLSLSEMNQIQEILLVPKELGSQEKNDDFLMWDTISSDFRKFKIKEPETYSQILDHSVDRIRDIASGYDNIVIGPWFSELGFELLYWVPFLNHVMTGDIWKEKNVITVSRGGVEELYRFIPNRHINLLEFYTQVEWSKATSRVWGKLGGLKQSQFVSEEIELLRMIRNHTDVCKTGRTLVLHPSIMFSLFRPFWRNKDWNASLVEKYLDFPELSPGKTENYCAVKIYSRPSLLLDNETSSAIRSLLDAEALPLRIIVSDSYEDDHEVMMLKSTQRAQVIHIEDYVSNLHEQFVVIKESRACYTTYGGLSYFGLYQGKPSFGLYSDSSKFDQQHLKVANILARKFGTELVLIQV
jgi:hypothetical protein